MPVSDMLTLESAAVRKASNDYIQALNNLIHAVLTHTDARADLAAAVVRNSPDLRTRIIRYYEAQDLIDAARKWVDACDGAYRVACNELVRGTRTAVLQPADTKDG